MDLTELDKTFDYYEKRYNLSKMAIECGIPLKSFNSLNSKEKFLKLSFKLKESNKTNLASFFFGKLFEVSQNFEALINKIECLINLQEYEEAIRYNNIGWELLYEDSDINPEEYEKVLSFQKAMISFYIERYHPCEQLCEENIIKFKANEFYYLLCANFIASDNLKSAIKLFNKYSKKFDSSLNFLIEVLVYILNVNLLDKAIVFIDNLFDLNENQKKEIINIANKYYAFSKNKSIIINYFHNELNFSLKK